MSGERLETASPGEETQKLHDRLRALQEPKGYFFNADADLTWPLLEQLLVTRAR